MHFYREFLADVLAQEEAQIVFPQLKLDASEIIERECYKALYQIKAILEDAALGDAAALIKIEEIIQVFVDRGVSCGDQYDY